MRLIKAILEARYTQIPDGISDVAKLYQAVKGDAADESNPAFIANFIDKDNKSAVVVASSFTNLSVEGDNAEQVLGKIASLFENLSKTIKYKTADRLALRTSYVQPFQGEFDSLVQSYKELYFTDNQLAKDAIDVGIVLTTKFKDYHINYNAGPMKKDDVKERQIINFECDELPEVYKYVDLDFYLTDFKFSTTKVAKFLKETHESQLEFINKFVKEVKQ
jgi:hypothetical protein